MKRGFQGMSKAKTNEYKKENEAYNNSNFYEVTEYDSNGQIIVNDSSNDHQYRISKPQSEPDKKPEPMSIKAKNLIQSNKEHITHKTGNSEEADTIKFGNESGDYLNENSAYQKKEVMHQVMAEENKILNSSELIGLYEMKLQQKEDKIDFYNRRILSQQKDFEQKIKNYEIDINKIRDNHEENVSTDYIKKLLAMESEIEKLKSNQNITVENERNLEKIKKSITHLATSERNKTGDSEWSPNYLDKLKKAEPDHNSQLECDEMQNFEKKVIHIGDEIPEKNSSQRYLQFEVDLRKSTERKISRKIFPENVSGNKALNMSGHSNQNSIGLIAGKIELSVKSRNEFQSLNVMIPDNLSLGSCKFRENSNQYSLKVPSQHQSSEKEWGMHTPQLNNNFVSSQKSMLGPNFVQQSFNHGNPMQKSFQDEDEEGNVIKAADIKLGNSIPTFKFVEEEVFIQESNIYNSPEADIRSNGQEQKYLKLSNLHNQESPANTEEKEFQNKCMNMFHQGKNMADVEGKSDMTAQFGKNEFGKKFGNDVFASAMPVNYQFDPRSSIKVKNRENRQDSFMMTSLVESHVIPTEDVTLQNQTERKEQIQKLESELMINGEIAREITENIEQAQTNQIYKKIGVDVDLIIEERSHFERGTIVTGFAKPKMLNMSELNDPDATNPEKDRSMQKGDDIKGILNSSGRYNTGRSKKQLSQDNVGVSFANEDTFYPRNMAAQPINRTEVKQVKMAMMNIPEGCGKYIPEEEGAGFVSKKKVSSNLRKMLTNYKKYSSMDYKEMNELINSNREYYEEYHQGLVELDEKYELMGPVLEMQEKEIGMIGLNLEGKFRYKGIVMDVIPKEPRKKKPKDVESVRGLQINREDQTFLNPYDPPEESDPDEERRKKRMPKVERTMIFGNHEYPHARQRQIKMSDLNQGGARYERFSGIREEATIEKTRTVKNSSKPLCERLNPKLIEPELEIPSKAEFIKDMINDIRESEPLVAKCERLLIPVTQLVKIGVEEREYALKTIDAQDKCLTAAMNSDYITFCTLFAKFVKQVIWLDKTVMWGATKTHIPENIKESPNGKFILGLGKAMPVRYNNFQSIMADKEGWHIDSMQDPYNIIYKKAEDSHDFLVRATVKLTDFNIGNVLVFLNEHEIYKFWYPFVKECNLVWEKEEFFKFSEGHMDIPFVSQKKVKFFSYLMNLLDENGTIFIDIMTPCVATNDLANAELKGLFSGMLEETIDDRHEFSIKGQFLEIKPQTSFETEVKILCIFDHKGSIPESIVTWMGAKFARQILKNLVDKSIENQFKKSVWYKYQMSDGKRQLYQLWLNRLDEYYSSKGMKYCFLRDE